MESDFFPNVLPKPTSKPKLPHPLDTKLAVTPEKMAKEVVKGNDEQEKATRKKGRKVMFEENLPKDVYVDCSLAQPTLHSSSLLAKKIKENRNEKFDLSKALTEIRLSKMAQMNLSEEITPCLNYGTGERKFTNLPSLEINTDDSLPKIRRQYVRKKKPADVLKPCITDFPMQFNENAKLDFEDESSEASESENNEEECFDYLLDGYKTYYQCY